MAPLVGVLALQGDVREHVHALEAVGARAIPVRDADALTSVHGLVIPGGESTTMSKLAVLGGLIEPLRAARTGGMPMYGSCAGMIMLADRILDGRDDQETIGGLDITVRRNAFGRQVESFEADLEVKGIEGALGPGGASVPGPATMRAVFIRAPWVEHAGPDVDVLASAPRTDGTSTIVAVQSGALLATSFHPELTGDTRIHDYFVQIVRQHA